MTAILLMVGLGAGIILGLIFPGFIPPQFTTYVAVGLLAGVDTLLGGLNAYTKGQFRWKIFLSGFIFNTILAALLTWFGNLLSLDLYLAAVVVFGARIFHNLAELRRMLLHSSQKNDKLDV